MTRINIFFNELRISDGAIWLDNETIKLSAPKKFQNQETNDFIKNNRIQIKSILNENLIFSKERFLDTIILKDSSIKHYPLSPAQERLWFIEQYEGGTNAYHIPSIFELETDTNVDAIKYALQQIVVRHEVLRSTIEQRDDQPQGIQVVHDTPLVIGEITLSDDKTFLKLIQDDINHPFNLSVEYPIRSKLYHVQKSNTKDGNTISKKFLLINIHHIASDGWSMSIFQRELHAYYTAYVNHITEFALPPLEIQYKDYSVWQKAYLTGEILEDQLHYWKNKLSGYQTLELPADLVRPSRIDYKGAHEVFKLNKDVSHKLRSIAQRNGTTLYSVMLSGTSILLGKYTGQDDIIIGSPIANRHHQQTEGLIGFFVNTQANRVLLREDQSCEALIKQVHKEQMETQLHQDLPFEKLVEELGVIRDTSRHPIFQVMFSVQSFSSQNKSQVQQKSLIKPVSLEGNYKIEKFDMSIFIDDNQEEIVGIVSYATSLFHKDSIKRFTHLYSQLLTQLSETPDKTYSQISLLSTEEHNQFIYHWSKTGEDYPKGRTIPQVFQEQVMKFPENIALVYENFRMNFRELDQRSNQLARYIQLQYQNRNGKPIAKNTLIALYIERSPELIVGVLAILKVGGAYVPIDTNYPQERIDYILEDTDTELILSQKHLNESDIVSLPKEKVIVVDLTEELYKKEDSSNLMQVCSGGELAYVIYTSGTTGKPKGVMVGQEAILSLVWSNYIDVSSNDIFAFLSSPVFDATTFELFTPLLKGNTLVIPKDVKNLASDIKEFKNFLKNQKITVLWLTKTLFDSLYYGDNTLFEDLNYLITGGEALDKNTVNLMINNPARPRHLLNGYGPTESTTFTCTYSLDKTVETISVPIGKPISNRTVYILDKYLKPVPIGVIGELYIGGAGLAHGYLKRSELTKECFVSNPFASEKDKKNGFIRLYRTGDLVRWLPDGNIEFMGRNDDQVKIRGFRIELGEIEHALTHVKGIKQSCVIVKERKTESGGNKYIVAYYVMDGSETTLTSAIILEKLSHTLPDYMLPSAMVLMESLPLTSNGKLDRRALPDPDLGAAAAEAYVAPSTVQEVELCQAWAKVLGAERIGVTDEFFAVGGNSILAIQASHRMSRVLGRDVKVADIFRYRTIAQLLDHGVGGVRAYIPRVSSDRVDLSFAQERLWFIEQYEEGSSAYHIPALFELGVGANREALKSALRAVVARHEVLRSTIEQAEGEKRGIQVVHHEPLLIGEISVSAGGDYISLIRDDINRPFDLAHEYPIRVVLYDVQFDASRSGTLLLINTHHIASDGWSMGIFQRELSAYYSAHLRGDFAFRLPELEIQYKDFAVWQRNYLSGEMLNRQLAYWNGRLAGFQNLEMPTDFVRPNEVDYRGSNLGFTLGLDASRQLRTLAQRHGATLYSVMLSSFSILFGKYTGQDDIVIGSPMANRHHRQTEGLIGFFVNTQANRILLGADQNFDTLVRQVQRDQIEAQQHQDLPFERLVEELGVTRDLSRNPVFQVMFTVQSFGSSKEEQGDELGHLVPFNIGGAYEIEKFDLSIFIDDSREELRGQFSYATSLFRADTIERLIAHYQRLLARLLEASDKAYSKIALISEAEFNQITREWNRPDHEYPNGKTIPQLFGEQVARTPEGIALVYNEQQLTYRQLDERSNQLARHIRTRYQQRTGQPLAPSTLIALSMERSLEMIVGILGVLKAGGAYVPMDPGYPQERVDYILGDTKVELVISHRSATRRAEFPNERIVYADLTEPLYHEEDVSSLPMYSQAPDLAYIIYTSGSTGNPKGVRITHRNFCPLMHWGYEVMRLKPDDRVLQNLSYYFDWSVWEIFIALTSGASLYMVSKEFLLDPVRVYDFVESNKITVIHGTPSWFSSILQPGKRLDSLRMLIPGAEKLGVDTILRYIEHVSPECRIFNMYGPTEATIMSAVHEIDRSKLAYYQTLGSIPIGEPIANLSLAVLDRNMNHCPVGVPGELYICGDGVSKGYLNDEEKTRRAFIPNPLSELRGETLYKTGDQVRWLTGGSIEFFGRNDDQVKIRGFRIELGEIENALTRIAGIKQGCVLVRERKLGSGSDKYLVGYYVLEEGITIGQAEIREALVASLPEHMVPSILIAMDFFPMNLNGKLDRRALPNPDLGAVAVETYVAPTTKQEVEVSQVWADILGIERVGVTDEFFSLGGNSILAIQASHRMSRALGRDVKVADIFRYRTIAQLLGQDTDGVQAIIPRVNGNRADLSFAQERLWFIEQYEEGSSAYHIPALFELGEGADCDVLKRALRAVVSRHEVLRSTIEQPDGQGRGVQVVHDTPLPIEEVKVPAGADYKAILRKDINRPFNLGREYPIRVTIYDVQLSDSQHSKLLLINTHHIASDGWSMGIFQRELSNYYSAYLRGDDMFRIPELEIQYKDFAVWQRDYLSGETLNRQLSYWKGKLSGFQNLELPTDFVRPGEVDYRGASQGFTLGVDASRQLRALAQRHGATLYSAMLSSLSILLGKYSGQDDIVIGSPMANRHHQQTEGLIGFFVNTQANRILLNVDQNYDTLINQVQKEQIEAQQHQDLPFERLVEELGVTRDLSRNPVYQVMFSVQSFGSAKEDQGDEQDYLVPFHLGGAYEIEKFDLSIFIDDSQEELRGQFSYATSLFSSATIERLITRYKLLLSRLLESPDMPYGQISLIDDAEREQILYKWNRPDHEYPNEKTIPQLFGEQVKRTPDGIALVGENHRLTYDELDRKSNQLARRIRTLYQERIGQPLPSGVMIALSLDRSVEMIIGILGALKAGGAYVPMDPNYPQERVDYILGDTQTELIVAQHGGTRRTELPSDKIVYADLTESLYKDEDDAGLPIYSQPDGLAYVIYTSGSTGNPKGVRISHRNFCPLMHWGYEVMRLRPDDRVLQNLSYYFDWSVWEIFIALTSGTSLYTVPKDLLLDPTRVYDYLENNGITVVHGTPSWFSSILQPGKRLDNLRMLIPGAEKLGVDTVLRYIEHVNPECRIFNMYGPTEATIMSAVHEIDRDKLAYYQTLGSIPIGEPIANLSLVVLDRSKNLCPEGIPGELYIAGDGVSVGYLNDEEKTRRAFLTNTISGLRGQTLYKTGDQVRWLSDGSIEFFGRNDDQVKIRGFRIELGEIENALTRIAGVKQACVLVRERRTGAGSDKYIVGYYVLESGVTLPQTDIRSTLAGVLPEHMVPAILIAMDSFPMNLNGKLDRRALPDPDLGAMATETYVAPVTEQEIELCRVWAEVLGTQRVGVTDEFFSIGGNSILAIQISHRMSKVLGYDIRVADVFRLKSIDKLLAAQEVNFELVKPYNQNYNPDLEDMIFISPGRAGSEMYQHLTEMLSSKYNCIGIDNYNIHNKKKIDSLNKLANHYLSEYEKRYSFKETVNLLGWSLGGQIALEMAGILETKGFKSINVILLDTYLRDENTRKLISGIQVNTEDAIKQDESYMIEKFGADYFEKVKSASEAEAKIADSSISNRIKYSNVILFKATQANPSMNTEISRLMHDHYKSLKSNNIDLIASNIEVFNLDCHHFNLIDSKGVTVGEFLLSNKVLDKIS
ncbi:MAG: amino acid adenylation domain-containing protein [Bacteroidales bacterium]|nr:amino acid adenylation domain-containing protein [Bacteroidales bacterium]